MDSTLSFVFFLIVVFSVDFVAGDSSPALDAWETRVNATLAFLRNRPCWGLLRGVQCDPTIPLNIADQNMSLYTAERSQGQGKLRAVLADKKYRRLTPVPDQYDAVLVLDPLPDANFGHNVSIFLIDFDVDRRSCEILNGVHVFTGRDECIRIAKKPTSCLNRVIGPKRIKCETNFIPLVHSTDDQSLTQLLQCRETLNTRTFARCRGFQALQTPPCSVNSARCSSGPTPDTFCTYEMCDAAVLVSGGWNSYTSRPRYRRNLHKMWKLLHSVMRYKESNIVTFYGQGQKEELHRRQQDNAYAVDKADPVSKYIKSVCSSVNCVDTLTIYLTGPSFSDGSLMFWDVNGRGLFTENSMLYTPKELFDDIKNCSAKRIYIVADYSYSGVMVEKLKNRIPRHRNQFKNLLVMTSSSVGEYSWRSDFTDAFVEKSRTGNRIKCVREVFQEVKQEFATRNALSTPEVLGENTASTMTTLYGGRCNVTWEEVRATNSCRLLSPHEWQIRPGN